MGFYFEDNLVRLFEPEEAEEHLNREFVLTNHANHRYGQRKGNNKIDLIDLIKTQTICVGELYEENSIAFIIGYNERVICSIEDRSEEDLPSVNKIITYIQKQSGDMSNLNMLKRIMGVKYKQVLLK